MDPVGADADFEAFVRRWSPSLYVTARGLTGSSDLAEELLQDTFASLYGKWTLVTAADSPIAYVRRALTNRFLSEQRRTTAGAARWEVPPVASGSDPADDIAAEQWLAWLVSELPARQRAAVLLRYRHDLDDRQIAEHLGCRVGTVRSLISRGVKALQARAAAAVVEPIAINGRDQL